MENCNRKKTNSITHLVKIVAEEVANEVFDKKLECISQNPKIQNIAELISGLSEFDTSNRGQIWPDADDYLLEKEVEFALAQIAKNHKRTVGAIRSRIRQKDLI